MIIDGGVLVVEEDVEIVTDKHGMVDLKKLDNKKSKQQTSNKEKE